MFVPFTPLVPSMAKAKEVGMLACSVALFALMAFSTAANGAKVGNPVAVSVVLCPAQMVGLDGEMVTVGSGFTVTVTDAQVVVLHVPL